MIETRADTLSKNHYGVLSQPFSLLVIITVAAIIISLLVLSLQNITADSQIHQVEHEINTILTEASNMFEYSEEGALVTIHVNFPQSLRFLVFGGVPINNTTEPSDHTLHEVTSNNYYYLMADGSLHVFHSNARFSDRTLTQLAIFHSGSFDLRLELCRKEGKTYVSIYQ